MQIIIVGAGVVGFHVAQQLVARNHDITVIDIDPLIIDDVASRLDVIAITGDGTSPSVLEKAKIRTAEMVVMVTSSDEINLLGCFLSFKMGVPIRIGRIRKTEWFQPGLMDPSEFAVDNVINPDSLIVNYVRKIIETPGLVDLANFSDPGLSLLGFKILPQMPISGKRLSDLRSVFSLEEFLIATIYRNNEMIIPSGEDFVMEGDICYILTQTEMIPLVLPIFNRTLDPVNSVIIFGGSRTGLLIAQNLENSIPNLTLVEPDKPTAELSAEKLEKSRVLYGDTRDSSLLNELNISEVDVLISAGREEKSNLLGSLLAKNKGTKKVITITDETEYLSVMDAIGLDVVINPKLIIAGEVLMHIQKGKVHSVIEMKTGGVEMIEVETSSNSRAVGKPLSKLNIPRGALIGAVMDEDGLFFPNGETILQPNQKVILISRSDAAIKANNFFL